MKYIKPDIRIILISDGEDIMKHHSKPKKPKWNDWSSKDHCCSGAKFEDEIDWETGFDMDWTLDIDI